MWRDHYLAHLTDLRGKVHRCWRRCCRGHRAAPLYHEVVVGLTYWVLPCMGAGPLGKTTDEQEDRVKQWSIRGGLGLVLLLSFGLVACGGGTKKEATSTAAVQELASSPAGQATAPAVTAAATSSATATAATVSEETPLPSAAPTGCQGVDLALQGTLDSAEAMGYGLKMGCPTSAAYTVQGAIQPFSGGIMLWRADTRKIYVLRTIDQASGQAVLITYDDLWQEGMPEKPQGCDSTPPSGLFLPIRGFGKVWCDNSLINTMGWGTFKEMGATLVGQDMAGGVLMRVYAPDTGETTYWWATY